MNNRWITAAGLLLLTACSSAPTVQSALDAAQAAMGHPDSIGYTGTGMSAFFGQALTAGKEWPRRDLTKYVRTINYMQSSGSEEMSFTQPVFGGQQQNAEVNGNLAWNI